MAQQNDIYAKEAKTLFEITMKNTTNCHVYDGTSNSMRILPVQMYNAATGGLFIVENIAANTFRLQYNGHMMK